MECNHPSNNLQTREIEIEEFTILIRDKINLEKAIITFLLDETAVIENEEGALIIKGKGWTLTQNPSPTHINIRDELTNPEISNPNEYTSTISNSYGEFKKCIIFEMHHNKNSTVQTNIEINS